MLRLRTRGVLYDCCLFIVVSVQSSFAVFSAIQPIPCTSSTGGEKGICTFNWHCTNVANGVYMGTCVDRFFVGVCCKFSQSTENRTEFTIRNYKSHPSVLQTSEKPISMIDIAHFNVTLTTNEHRNSEHIPTSTEYPTSTDGENESPIPETTATFGTQHQIPSASSLLHRMFPSLSLDYFQSLLSPKGYTSKSNPERRTTTLTSTPPTSIISWRSAFRIPIYPKPSLDASNHRRYSNDKILKEISPEDWWRPMSLHETLNQRDSFLKSTPHTFKYPIVDESHQQRHPVQVRHDHDLRKPVQVHALHDFSKPAVSESHNHWHPVQVSPAHDLRKPVQVHPLHDLRKPVLGGSDLDLRQPVQVIPLHDLRKPVLGGSDLDLRQLVQVHPLHDLRKPVANEEAHDQRWPVIENDDHDLRNPLTYDYYPDGNEENNASVEDSGNPIPVSDLFKGIEVLFDDKNEYSFASSTHNVHSVTESSFSVTEEVFSTPSPIFSNDLLNTSDAVISRYTTPHNDSFVDTTSYVRNRAYTLTPLKDLTQPEETDLRDTKKVCGRPRGGTTARIVGGRKTHHLRWPWMVSLREMEGMISKHICGATLLNHLWTITAAHCVEGKPPTRLTLRLGEETYRRRDLFHPSEERRVYVLVVHPGYDGITYENDLALLRTREPVTFGPGVLPACLPDHPHFQDLTGRTGIVTGWGRLAEKGALPSFLHQVHLPILSNSECESMYQDAGFVERIRSMFVCAGTADGGVDACDGDSGGPMVVSGPEGEWTLVGIISWGMGCGAPKQPGVYIRITEFTSWINGIISH